MVDTYEFARSSRIPNVGEDFKDSARHKRNKWRSLQEAEETGVAAALVTRDNLLKNEPSRLIETISPETAIAHLIGYLVLRAFPAKPFTTSDYDSYRRYCRRRDVEPLTDGELRAQYYDEFTILKKCIEESVLIVSCLDLQKDLAEKIKKRETDVVFRDRGITLNPVFKGLSNMQKRVRPKRHPKTQDVSFKILEFQHKIEANYSPEERYQAVYRIIKDILQGKSLDECFGVKSAKSTPKLSRALLYAKNVERVGLVYFPNPSPNSIVQVFNLRGIQFGNYVSDSERQGHVNHIAEALADLADIIDWKQEQIGLGQIGLAVGARGKAGSLAHYEGKDRIINLSKVGGIGALAHEWWHAFDHSLAEWQLVTDGDKLRSKYLSETAFYSASPDQKYALMKSLLEALDSSGYRDRLKNVVMDQVRGGQIPRTKIAYWLSYKECTARAFEKYVQYKLGLLGRKNTYLSGACDSPLWLDSQEVIAIAPAIDKLLESNKEGAFARFHQYNQQEL